MIASVIVDQKAQSVDRPFDYNIPSYFESTVKVGCRVIVPFGKLELMGFVIEIKESSSYENRKDIIDVMDFIPSLTEELIVLAKNMHEYYYCFFITCLLTMIPRALRAKYQKKFVLNDGCILPSEISHLFKNNEYIYQSKDKEILPIIQKACKANILRIENIIKDSGNIKYVRKIILNKTFSYKLMENQIEIVEYLKEKNEPIDKSLLCNKFSLSRITTLVKNGVLSEYEEETLRKFDYGKEYVDKVVSLNSDQERVYNNIKAKLNTKETILLHGVTGSGKTEIYLKLINNVVKNGKNAILLVPEISLTPQIVARFKARFKSDVAVIHSGLSMGEKYDEWRKIMRHEVSIVVGARSAIFAPFENIGIIIIDEEHESSYQQDSTPRYDAKMIARIRAKNHNCLTLFGSATPSIESYYNAVNNIYIKEELSFRANSKQVPTIKVVDMVKELKNGNKSLFSNDLKIEIGKALSRKEQIILLLNRRGFSNFVMCRECGEVIKCPHCDVSLTYHKNNDSLKCHYCGYQMPNIKSCPVCHSSKIRFVGGGTQKVEEELIKEFKNVRVLRMDHDTTQNKDAYEKIITAFSNLEADVLVGTQMVAKGLDFPNCSLVGILNADLALKYPGYNSFAQAFNLFVQVSGRAGRHEKEGKVILQAYDTTNYAITNAKTSNYLAFYNEEINFRKLGGYPPFSKMIDILVIGKNYQNTYDEAKKILIDLRKCSNTKVLGPAEDFVVKVKDEYRFKLTIKFSKEKEISSSLKKLYSDYEGNKDYKLIISRM